MRPLKIFLSALLIALTVIGPASFSPAYAQTAPVTGSKDDGWGTKVVDALKGLVGVEEKTPAARQKEFQDSWDKSCWACDVFNAFSAVVFQKGNEVGAASGGLSQVITAFGMLFGLLTLGSGMFAGDVSDMARRWGTFWRLMMMCALGSIMIQLNAFVQMWDLVYGPLMYLALDVESAVTGGTVLGDCGVAFSAPGAPAGAAGVITRMGQIVCGGHLISVKGMGFAYALMTITDGIWGSIVNIIAGVCLFAVFLWVAISFPLRFIDVLLRLCVVGVLSPIFVILATFKQTRSYINIAISNVLYAGALFAFTGIMFSLGGKVFDDVVTKTMADMGSSTMVGTLGRGLVMLGMGFVFTGMIRMAPSLAAEFSSFRGATGGGAGDAATGFASGAASMSGKAGGAATGGAANVVTGAGQAARNSQGVAGALGKGVT